MQNISRLCSSDRIFSNETHSSGWYIGDYNPPINFRARELDKTSHVVQNRTTGISQYTPSDLISVVRYLRAVQIKRKKCHKIGVKNIRKPLNFLLFSTKFVVIIVCSRFFIFPR